MKKPVPELLAPAGDRQALDAVLEAGADAVYIAGKRFGMRQHAHWLNFDEADLAAAIRRVHDRGKRIYVTVNNLLTDVELDQTGAFLESLSACRPDAIIIQDLGLLHRLRGRPWPFELHASCMMNVHDLSSAIALARLGVSRIIASRDITLAAAARLQRESGVDFEIFLHGDMCIAQSGQCTTSGILSGESAGRGKCLKPCRWRWKLVGAGRAPSSNGDGLLLARKDLCLFEHIPALVESGIAVVKIEGRARKAAYLARIVRAYREAFDAYAADPGAYTMDEARFADLHAHRIRDYSTCVTFGDEGRQGIARDGTREPRIFSVVIEQRGLERPAPAETVNDPRHTRAKAGGSSPYTPELIVHCGSARAVSAAMDAGARGICIGGERWRQHRRSLAAQDLTHIDALCRGAGVKLYWMAPRINEQGRITDDATEAIAPARFDGCYVHTLGQFEKAGRLGVPAIADVGLNLFNVAAVAFAASLGAIRAVPSLELGLPQVRSIAACASLPLELVVHGPVVGMISEHCVVKASRGCSDEDKRSDTPPCARELALEDQAGQKHRVMTDAHCRNHILLPRHLCALPILGELLALRPACIRIDGRHESPETLRQIVTVYAGALARLSRGLPVSADALTQLATLHPNGLSLGAYELAVPDVAMPGADLPTREWVQPITLGRTEPEPLAEAARAECETPS